MNVIRGDFLALANRKQFDVIVHGCNCFHTMIAGIALQISKKYPQVLKED